MLYDEGHCGKVYKNAKELKIRQSRTKCGRGEKLMQCRVETFSGTQEDSSQEAAHSTGDLSAVVPPRSHRKDSPKATPGTQPTNDNTLWKQLDRDIERVLEASLAVTAKRKIHSVTTIVFNMARE